MKKVLMLFSLLMSGVAFGVTVKPTTLAELDSVTVKITEESGQSGGTGSILRSDNTGSVILTNAHICAVVENGGGLVNYKGTNYAVEKYVKSKLHDLCLIKVTVNLGVTTELAEDTPVWGEEVVITGHPFLMPTTITRGHMSNSMTVTMITEIAECDKKDWGSFPMECLMLGGMPVIKTYNTKTVSATIAPGNSGSAVYNASGKLVGVAFAGSGRGVTYAIIVPHEYVSTFLKIELKKSKWTVVSKGKKLSEMSSSNNNNTKSGTGFSFDLVNFVTPALFDTKLDLFYQKYLECSTSANKCSRN